MWAWKVKRLRAKETLLVQVVYSTSNPAFLDMLVCLFPLPVHGAWSEWTEQPCSKSCGGGFRIVTRECDNPAPQYGGDNCYGNPNKFEQCSTECCPSNAAAIVNDDNE